MRTHSDTTLLCVAAALLAAAAPALGQNGGPANEINCPAITDQAITPYVGAGTAHFSPNQSLCLPELAPVGGPGGALAFIVRGVEPGIRVDSQGTIYVDSIRGVPGGADLWRWDQSLGPDPDGAPNSNGTLPFRYEGQPDNCGILINGCANNTTGVAPGGGDADIAVNGPDPMNALVPNLAFVSLSLADVTATHSTNRGDSFSAVTVANAVAIPNPVSAAIPGDDRMWVEADADPSIVYMNYHDISTFNIEVQRSDDGGATYPASNGIGEAIDANTQPAANGGGTNSGNVAGQIRIDKNTNGCSSRGNLYQIFVAPDNATENAQGKPLRTVYVGVSTPAQHAGSLFTFNDYKIYTSAPNSAGANNGANQIFPALATDDNGWVYAVWSDNTNIWFSSSSTEGASWLAAPVLVNQDGTVGKANVFPWLAADADGHVVVAWLGASLAGNSNDRATMEKTCANGTNSCWAQWNVYAAETVNANAAKPTFAQYRVSDHVIHSGTVSTGGLGGSANRNLADFFQVALDGAHRANITFADDHLHSAACATQSPGHCADNDPATFRVGVPYFSRQLATNPHIVLPTQAPSSCFKPVS